MILSTTSNLPPIVALPAVNITFVLGEKRRLDTASKPLANRGYPVDILGTSLEVLVMMRAEFLSISHLILVPEKLI